MNRTPMALSRPGTAHGVRHVQPRMTRHLTRLVGAATLVVAVAAAACADEADQTIVDGGPVETTEPSDPTGTGPAVVEGDGWRGVLLDAHLDWLQLDDGTLIDEGVTSSVPAEEDVIRFEAGLPAALPPAANSTGEEVTAEDMDGYVRQYTGVEAEGHRQLIVAALCAPEDFPEWRTQWIEVNDGGTCFWDATMDLDTGEIIRFSFHGAA